MITYLIAYDWLAVRFWWVNLPLLTCDWLVLSWIAAISRWDWTMSFLVVVGFCWLLKVCLMLDVLQEVIGQQRIIWNRHQTLKLERWMNVWKPFFQVRIKNGSMITISSIFEPKILILQRLGLFYLIWYKKSLGTKHKRLAVSEYWITTGLWTLLVREDNE